MVRSYVVTRLQGGEEPYYIARKEGDAYVVGGSLPTGPLRLCGHFRSDLLLNFSLIGAVSLDSMLQEWKRFVNKCDGPCYIAVEGRNTAFSEVRPCENECAASVAACLLWKECSEKGRTWSWRYPLGWVKVESHIPLAH